MLPVEECKTRSGVIMPELPEVETIKLGLSRRVKGLRISSIDTNQHNMLQGDPNRAINAEIADIKRRAKILILDLKRDVIPAKAGILRSPMSEGVPSGSRMTTKGEVHSDARMTAEGDYSILVHLKMTGQLVFQSADEKIKIVGGHPQAEYNKPLPHAHTHIVVNFTDGSHLYFNDLRRFGWMKIIPTSEVENEPGIAKAGPEPLGEDFKNQKAKIKMIIQKSKKAISTLLMDQGFIAGIGNIYANEILYEAKIMPDRPASSLNDKEIESLFAAIPIILEKGLAHGGTSDSTYVGVDGERGDYLKVAAVYHQKTDPEGHPITTKKINGRTAHFCGKCQR